MGTSDCTPKKLWILPLNLGSSSPVAAGRSRLGRDTFLPPRRGRSREPPEDPEAASFFPPPCAGGGGARRGGGRPYWCLALSGRGRSLPRLPGEVARSAGGTGRRHLFASPACRGRWREAPEGAPLL